MGYRSDVTLLFYCEKAKPENKTKLKQWLETNLKEDFDEMEEFTKGSFEGYMVKWESVKWYESYEEVARVENAIARFCYEFEDEQDLMLEFYEVGEEYDDIKIKNSDNAYGLMTVTRLVDWA